MTEWYNSLSQLQRVFALIAIPSTLILIIQSLMLIFGLFGGGDFDSSGGDTGGDGMPDIHDFNGLHDGHDINDIHDGHDGHDGLALFSVRGIIAMLCVGGWLGIVLLDSGMDAIQAVLLAFIGGVAALFGMALLVKMLLQLQQSGNIEIANAVGKLGSVYLTIPGNMSGTGKINITVQDTYTEFDAMTSEQDEIKTGEAVRVVSTSGTGILMVKRVARAEREPEKTIM